MEKEEKFNEGVMLCIREHQLVEPDDKILVALSGGADSVALLLVLLQAGFHCEAAHCNFHLRGKESDRDEKFVRDLCRSRSIRLHTKDFDTMEYARKKGISIEMAARELRYVRIGSLTKLLWHTTATTTWKHCCCIWSAALD